MKCKFRQFLEKRAEHNPRNSKTNQLWKRFDLSTKQENIINIVRLSNGNMISSIDQLRQLTKKIQWHTNDHLEEGKNT